MKDIISYDILRYCILSTESQRPQTVSGTARTAASTRPASVPPAVPVGQFAPLSIPHPSSLHYAASAAGGGLAADETSQAPPLNFTDLDSLRPHLDYLIHIYGVQGVSAIMTVKRTCFRFKWTAKFNSSSANIKLFLSLSKRKGKKFRAYAMNRGAHIS